MTPSALAHPPESAPRIAPIVVPDSQPHPIVVRADNLGKKFRIYERPLDRLWEWLGRKSRAGKPLHTDFWAVRGISFEVRRGECLGIIGPNGSGKSTLLKMIAGALQPTEGSFNVGGRVLSLIELGTGLNPLLSGRANITTAATLLGFPPSYARDRIDDIEAFAELGEFFDRPVNLYSTGMRVRLAFSMFACFRPEVFIVDEALSVGDVFFQQKCAARIREMMAAGMTMIFVSHDQSAVLNLCTRAIVLNHGQAIFQGAPDEAISRYLASLSFRGSAWKPERPAIPAPTEAPASADSALAASVLNHDITVARRPHRHGTGELTILAARLTNHSGLDTLRAQVGEMITIQVLLEAHEDIAAPRAGLRIFDRFSNMVFAAGTFQLGHRLPAMNAGDRLVVSFSLTLDLQPDKYTLGLGAGEPVDGDPNAGIAHDRIDRLGPLIVDIDPSATRPFYGIARLPLAAAHYPCPPGNPP
jgi:lipopolysaccharide transport system ATP-binding protein